MENKSVRIKLDIIDKLKNAKHQISLDDEDLEHYQEAIDDAIEIVKSSIIPEPVKKLSGISTINDDSRCENALIEFKNRVAEATDDDDCI